MIARSWRLCIEDIWESMQKIESYTAGMNFENFENNRMAVEAVAMNFTVIGEAANHIPENIRHEYPNIPWRRMIGLRNLVIHEYFRIDLPLMWEIIIAHLPETKTQIESLLKISENNTD